MGYDLGSWLNNKNADNECGQLFRCLGSVRPLGGPLEEGTQPGDRSEEIQARSRKDSAVPAPQMPNFKLQISNFSHLCSAAARPPLGCRCPPSGPPGERAPGRSRWASRRPGALGGGRRRRRLTTGVSTHTPPSGQSGLSDRCGATCGRGGASAVARPLIGPLRPSSATRHLPTEESNLRRRGGFDVLSMLRSDAMPRRENHRRCFCVVATVTQTRYTRSV